MKPAIFLSVPVLAFIGAMMLAGLVPQSENTATGSRRPDDLSPRKRAEAMGSTTPTPGGIPAVLAGMERLMVHFPPPEVKTYNGDEMEASLNTGNFPVTCGSGMAEIEYSMGWARENPQEMFEWLVRQSMVSGFKKHSLAHTLFSEWAEQNMSAALVAIPHIPDLELRAQSLVTTLEILCQKDPTKAQELLHQNLQTLESLKTVYLGYDHGKTRTDLLLSLPPGKTRSMLLAENISSMTQFPYNGDGVLAAELWAKAPDDERREMVAAGLTSSRSSDIPLDGLENLVKQHAETTSDPERSRQFIAQYGESWAERDPGSAVSWAMAHLQGKARMDQTLKLITHIGSRNFDEALRTWQVLPDGSLRDRAARNLAEAAPPDHQAEKAILQDSLPKSDMW